VWLEEEKQREEERLNRKRRRMSAIEPRDQRPLRAWGREEKQPIELLPSPPSAPLRMDSDAADVESQPVLVPLLSIKGAAKELEPKRKSLLERLAKAKAEAASNGTIITATTTPASPVDTTTAAPLLPHSISEPTILKGRGLREVVRARIALKMKLENERATFRHNVNESKAQELRRRLLEAKARREAEETDATLKRLDRIDRQAEVRRRLMVAKMMAAETEAERRARELREKLLARKRSMAEAQQQAQLVEVR